MRTAGVSGGAGAAAAAWGRCGRGTPRAAAAWPLPAADELDEWLLSDFTWEPTLVRAWRRTARAARARAVAFSLCV
jgi:hypothetical protein